MDNHNALRCAIVSALAILLTGSRAALGADALQMFDLRYQWASEVDGPWENVPQDALYMAGDGSIRVASDAPQKFFRLRIGKAGEESALPVHEFNELPEAVTKIVFDHVARIAANGEEGSDGDAERWRNATVAPFAVPLLAGWEDDAEGARYAEIKVIAGDEAGEPNEEFLPDDSTIRPDRDRGYIIVSLDRSDFPVLEWATEGPTPSEELLRLASSREGARIARIARFGPTLIVAEDDEGRPVANLGTEPVKVLPAALDALRDPVLWEFDTEDEAKQEDPPRMEPYFDVYESYEEMKDDLQSNPFRQAMRKHRQRLAGYVWDVVEGQEPEVLAVEVGETRTFLAETVFGRVEAQWEEPDDVQLARVLALPDGGIQITGSRPGSTLLSLYGPDGIVRYSLWVTDERETRTQGSRTMEVKVKDVTRTWYAGNWGDQKRYHQTSHPDWCRKVGCGPVALAMLVGWWDHKGVPSAFYRQTGTAGQRRESLRTADAPFSSNNFLVHPSYYHYLHDLCDVICFGAFSQLGATWPADMIEAVHGYLRPLGPWWFTLGELGVTQPLIGYNMSWAWDSWGDDWQTSGVRVAKGIKNGQPGIVGLGVLWHYVVAYGYRRRDVYIEINGQKEYTIGIWRYFKVNQGWGKKYPAWYSAYDVFLGMRANIWQKSLPPPP